MKKPYVALSALAAMTVSSVAPAQSSITLFGVVDASIAGDVTKVRNTTPVTPAQRFDPNFLYVNTLVYRNTRLASNNYNTSRIGFRGTEDLGGGLAAGFWLESRIANDDGSLGVASFTERSTISLSGVFGEFRMGRDFKPTDYNIGIFDPFGGNGAGTAVFQQAWFPLEFGGNVQVSNSVGYFTPKNLGGFFGEVSYAFGERPRTRPGTLTPACTEPGTPALCDTRSGRYIGGRVGYAKGPLDVALAYGLSTNASEFQAGSTTRATNWNLGASYDFKIAKVSGFVGRIRNALDFDPGNAGNAGIGGTTKNTGYLLGVTVPVGPGLIRAAYSRMNIVNEGSLLPKRDYLPLSGGTPQPRADQFALGYIHNLSKRTALYATVAYIKNRDGANIAVHFESIPALSLESLPGQKFEGKTSMGYDIGIRHAF